MEFGIFDHLDRGDVEMSDFYETRLRIAEAYDRAGFFCYHIAEHHSTPLGMAPSPSVFLSAVAQRTKRLKFGPLIYMLPLYHPLRLVEEICMLDHMSGGRLQIGVGRGASPFELTYYGRNPDETPEIFAETLAIVLKGLEVDNLTYEGKFHRFQNVPIELKPAQRPRPPIWYGIHSIESAEHCARQGYNIMLLDSMEYVQPAIAHYRATWRAQHGGADPSTMYGMGRFIVVSDTDEKALAIAREAYLKWHQSFHHLFRLHGSTPRFGERPPSFDGLIRSGHGVAGSPETVTKALRAQVAEAGINYLVGQFAFGNMPEAYILRSVDLYAREVMPALRS